MYGGDCIARYKETKAKKQELWDKLIGWCKDHSASTGESMQSDDFVLDAPVFMAEAIDEIVKFEKEWVV